MQKKNAVTALSGDTMKIRKILSAIILALAAGKGVSQEYVDYVEPLMGTRSTFEFSHGNTYPAIARPWGMNFWSPQTGANGSGWMYAYTDTVIRGFRQTHQPSPWINDYGTFSVMPLSGKLRIAASERGELFRHEKENASPEAYAVTMENGVAVELSATRTGMIMEVSYPTVEGQYLIIDAMRGGCRIEIDQINRRITGYVKNNHGGVPDNFANYFTMEFSHPIAEKGVMVNDSVMPGKMAGEHDRVCAYLRFIVPTGEKLVVKTASSFISPEQASTNYRREVSDKTLAQIKAEARKEWNDALGRIEVTGGTPEQQKTFYSCLYRVLLFPREFYEYDTDSVPVYYSPYDGQIHEGYMYTDNGFWDTFRAVHPLFTLIYPEVTERVIESLLNAYDESGFMPEWASPGHRNCMIGNNSVSLIADAYAKGIRNFDTEKALKAMINQVEAQGPVPSCGRNGHKEYFEIGYVPYPDYTEATAKTLEYSYADWCVSQYAAQTGNSDMAAEYETTAYNYRNLFDKRHGFMRARNKNGEWIEPFRPEEWGGPFTEGSSWHYTWSVMHDVEGLARLMGGYKAMETKLDSMFAAPPVYDYGTYGFVIHEIAEMVALDMGQYAHGNQPVQHAIYLYDYIGAPWKAQYHSRQVMERLYSPMPAGYCGDEDNGQTSAWYVFSAMGFYPVCPGRPEYAVGSPLFDTVKLNLPEGKTFMITATENGSGRPYIESAKLNGKNFKRNYLKHEEITAGGEIKVKMTDKPNTERGTDPAAYPTSLTPIADK